MDVKLEYIMSGTSFIGLHQAKSDEVYSQYSDILGHLKSETKHSFGLLFNAFQEVKNGENVNRITGLDSIHADSGGLQMITRGMTATEADKVAVYKTQARLSTIGMCFDEIPVDITESSSRNDYGGRFFNPDRLEECASQTGRNIAKQIEVFLELESECKPFLIAQGNCYDTYMKWTETVLKNIPKEHHKHIGGIAMGAAALGTGYLEEVEKAFICSQLPVDTNSVHILGVGSMSRMIPIISMIRGGLYDGKHVSYDSTTHSSAVEMGRHTIINSRGLCETLKYGKVYSKAYDLMYDDVSKIYDHGLTRLEFKNLFSEGAGQAREKIGIDKFFLCKAASSIVSATNFAKSLESAIEDDNVFLQNVGKLSCLSHLDKVKSKSDFDHWMKQFSKSLKSNRVSIVQQTNTVDDFFN